MRLGLTLAVRVSPQQLIYRSVAGGFRRPDTAFATAIDPQVRKLAGRRRDACQVH
jgi:hypothetical protein